MTSAPDGGNDDRIFLYILWTVTAVFFIASVVITVVDLPKIQHAAAVEKTPRTARLLLEKPKPPVPKPQPKKPAKPLIQKKTPPPVSKKPRVQKDEKIRQAREKALHSGVLALQSQLTELENNQVIDTIGKNRKLSKAAEIAAPKNSTKKLDTAIADASKGLDASALKYKLGQMQLEARQTAQVNSTVAERAAEQASGNGRSMEEIELVMDRNKGKLNALYNRALRRNPVLAGKLVMSITIAPSGKVTACKIVSSELGDADLEKKLVTAVLLIAFPSADVPATTVQYPIEFYPR